MDDGSTNASLEPEECRPPSLRDLVTICRALNEHSARYLVIGGFAIAQKGFIRTTKDIDFLVDSSAENIARIKAALMVLPDGAAREVRDTDVEEYNVVRIGDEVMVDLLGKACGVSYDDAQSDIEWQEYEGVRIPFAGWRVLYRTKQTYRESDALDRLYLAEAMHKRGIPVPKKQ